MRHLLLTAMLVAVATSLTGATVHAEYNPRWTGKEKAHYRKMVRYIRSMDNAKKESTKDKLDRKIRRIAESFSKPIWKAKADPNRMVDFMNSREPIGHHWHNVEAEMGVLFSYKASTRMGYARVVYKGAGFDTKRERFGTVSRGMMSKDIQTILAFQTDADGIVIGCKGESDYINFK